MLTDKNIFRKVQKHLLRQNQKSARWNSCLFRLEKDGKHLRCAVGCLIHKRHYDKSLENSTANQDDVRDAIKASNPNWKMTDRSVTMLNRLQWIHDAKDTDEWARCLKETSREFTRGKQYAGH